MNEEYLILNFTKLDKDGIDNLVRKISHKLVVDRIAIVNKIIDDGDDNIATHPNFQVIIDNFKQEVLLGHSHIIINGTQKDKDEVFNFLINVRNYKCDYDCDNNEFFIDIGNDYMFGKSQGFKVFEMNKSNFYNIFDRGYKRRDIIKDLL